MTPGTATFEQTGEDQVTLSWEAEDGALVEVDLTLREAADLQAGKAVSFYERVRRFSLRERIADLRARNDQIAARMGELGDRYPGLREPPERGDQHP